MIFLLTSKIIKSIEYVADVIDAVDILYCIHCFLTICLITKVLKKFNFGDCNKNQKEGVPYMKILILGAAGQIGRMVTTKLLEETNHQVILYARNAHSRLGTSDPGRVEIVDGDFNDQEKLDNVMHEVDLVYLNDMNSPTATAAIITSMKKAGVPTIIGATILGIYDEVAGEFGKWNTRMVGTAGIDRHKESAEIIEASGVNYTLLRLTWLYNQKDNEDYMTTEKGEPFIGAQVTRQAVTLLIMQIIENPNQFKNSSLGVSEPDTDWPKPSFY